MTFHDWLVRLDKKAAKVIGYSGRNTISAECGKDNSFFCRFICRAIYVFWPGHCQHAAAREIDVSQQ